MKIKMHRGSLAESMSTVQEIAPTTGAVVQYLIAQGMSAHDASPENISVAPYAYDSRIDWNIHLVKSEGLGVFAETDGPFQSQM